ncbi:hypothetical protein A2U01_0031554, partial [Trifolium medium]|nr:hypothetical protein [Trifolium medium]
MMMTQAAPIVLPTKQFGGDHDYQGRHRVPLWQFLVPIIVMLVVIAAVLCCIFHRRIA